MYFHGFDFSQIPSVATITSATFKIALCNSDSSSSSSNKIKLQNKSSRTDLSDSIMIPSSKQYISTATLTLTLTSLTIADVIALGNDFAFDIYLLSSSGTFKVFGMEILVTYDMPVPNKVDWVHNGVTKTVIDLTGDDVTAADVLSGVLFHLPSGEQATGSLVPPSGGLEYESGTWSPSSNETRRGTINLTKTHTAPPAIFAVWTTKENGAMNSSSACTFLGADYSALGDYTGSSSKPAGGWVSRYINSSGTQTNTNGYITSGGNNSGDSSSSYWRYFATESVLHPYSASSMIWRSNAVYNWIAIWV